MMNKFNLSRKVDWSLEIITISLLLIIVVSCQEKNPDENQHKGIKNNERFDIELFKDNPEVTELGVDYNPYNFQDTLEDGFILDYSESYGLKGETVFTKTITPPPPAMFITIKNFYETGVIKEEVKSFIGLLYVEPFYNQLEVKEYDQQGYLIKTEDNSDFDKKVNLRFNDLLKKLEQTPIITQLKQEDREDFSFYLLHKEVAPEEVTVEKINDYLKSIGSNGMILNPYSDFDRRNIKISLKKRKWFVTKDMYPHGLFHYQFDANSGVQLSLRYEGDQRP